MNLFDAPMAHKLCVLRALSLHISVNDDPLVDTALVNALDQAWLETNRVITTLPAAVYNAAYDYAVPLVYATAKEAVPC